MKFDAITKDVDEITEWIGRVIRPIEICKKNKIKTSFDYLISVLKDSRVVGVGESTHGTKEFFEIRLLLLEFLVVRLGFKNLVLEADYISCKSVNDFVLYGLGDLESVVKGMGSSVYHTKEFSKIISWLYVYNKSVGFEDKVNFYGIDIYPNKQGRLLVTKFIDECMPELSRACGDIFNVLSSEEERWPDQVINGSGGDIQAVLISLRQLMVDIINRSKVTSGCYSDERLADVIKNIKFMKQWVKVCLVKPDSIDLPEELGRNNLVRSRFLAENLNKLIEEAEINDKFIVWAHNYHIAKGLRSDSASCVRNFGLEMSNTIGKSYYAMCLESGSGTYLSREWQEKKLMLGGYKVCRLPSSSENSLLSFLSSENVPVFFINTKLNSKKSRVNLFLGSPHSIHCAGWIYLNEDSPKLAMRMVPNQGADGLIFFRVSTHATPISIIKEEGVTNDE